MLPKKIRSIVTDLAMEEFLTETVPWRDPGSRFSRKHSPVPSRERAAIRKRLREGVRQQVAKELEVDSILSSILVGLAIRFAMKLIDKWMDEL